MSRTTCQLSPHQSAGRDLVTVCDLSLSRPNAVFSLKSSRIESFKPETMMNISCKACFGPSLCVFLPSWPLGVGVGGMVLPKGLVHNMFMQF